MTLLRRVTGVFVVTAVLSACSLFSQVPTSLEDEGVDRVVQDSAPKAQRLRPTLRWKSCGGRFDCARLPVPLVHDRPGGEKIDLALIRLPAPAKADRIGSLVVNPGGPGGSGVDFVRYSAVETVPAEVRARFDIVGFDPRGVSRSSGLECGDEPQRFLSGDFFPDGAGDLDAVLASARSLADACAAQNATMLPHMSTADVSRDLDLIRRAVGDSQLTYLGFSYGSTIGLTYAQQFPERLRAMVLDGPVDPAIDGRRRAMDQATVLEKTLREFFRTCPRDDECRGYAERLSLRRFDDLLARLESSPVPAFRFPGRTLRPAEALMATAALLKDRGTGWPLLAAGIAMADQGDGSLLLGVAESSVSETTGRRQWLAPLLAVNCLDIPAPAVAEYPEAVDELSRRSDHFGPLMLLLASPCAYWSEPPQREPAVVEAADAPPSLIVGTTGDPTTPYGWAQNVAANLRAGRLITREGDTHTAFGRRNVCTDRSVSRYLVDLVLPPPDTSCG